MKAPKIKIKLPKIRFNWSKLFNILTLSLIGAVAISSVLISLPYTEKLLPNLVYNFNINNLMTAKGYTVTFDLEKSQETDKIKLINQTKDIIYKRLSKVDVTDTYISDVNSLKDDKPSVMVSVKTDDIETVENMIAQRYYLEFVTRKKSFDFDNTKDQLAVYKAENYDRTPYNRRYFRTVYITKLKSTSGDYAYFAIFKPWENKLNEFYSFFSQLQGQYAGLLIDDYVSPIQIPQLQVTSQSGGVTREPFAVGVGSTEQEAKLKDILMNSGNIPVKYVVEKINDGTGVTVGVDNIRTAIVLVATATVLTVLAWVFNRKQYDYARYISSSVVTLSGLVTFFKITSYQTYSLTILFASILFVLINLAYTKHKSYGYILVPILFAVVALGFVKDISILLISMLLVRYLFDSIYDYSIKLYTRIMR